MANIDERFLDENGRILPEYRGFNFGALVLSGIWGLFNGVYIALLIFPLIIIPFTRYFAPIFAILLGFKGNEWAIKNKRWGSPLHFLNVQRRWATLSIVVCIVIVIYLLESSPIARQVNAPVPNLQVGQSTEYKIAHNKSLSTLNHALSMNAAINGYLDISSGAAAAKGLRPQFSELSQVNGDTITDPIGITYKFDCNGKDCTVYVDINGAEGPNKISDNNNLYDIAVYKIVEKNGNLSVVKP